MMTSKEIGRVLVLTFKLQDAPNTQMGGYTLDPTRAYVQIENDAFLMVTVEKLAWRERASYKADDPLMPNWIRDFVNSVLPEGTDWPMRDERADEHVIHQNNDEKKGLVAIVHPQWVASFLRKDRSVPGLTAKDFVVTYQGETMSGDQWLKAYNKRAKAAA